MTRQTPDFPHFPQSPLTRRPGAALSRREMLAHTATAASVGALGLGLTGCSALGPLGKELEPFMPKVSFRNLDLKGLDFTRVAVDFVFAVANPNPLSVKADAFGYALELGGVRLIQGTNDSGLRLESRGTSELRLPVQVVFADLFKAVKSLAGQDKVPFGLRGFFGFNTPVGMGKIPFTETGDFPVVHMPDVNIRGLRMGKLDLLGQRASINLDLGVANQQGGSPLTFEGFDWNLSLGGRSVAGGLVQALATVAAGQAQNVTIPLDLNLGAVGATVLQALQGGASMDVGLKATAQVGTPFGKIPLSIDDRGNFRIGS